MSNGPFGRLRLRNAAKKKVAGEESEQNLEKPKTHFEGQTVIPVGNERKSKKRVRQPMSSGK